CARDWASVHPSLDVW
nr:immunoglobulin heavy chain junction region [Macaca mulatta]MOV38374.1 immunoglobulin heavy chain junction region [Macaca mulatta]MOV38430.1 immunoglobulin heavy chain junction region [Macaca mulatta]MOV38471.1 immunoglobulin heavy chain junction region [Macaca mulatta]MOV38543.1 immunoglobulin heavy chain junction region [Macaca mulatta]